MKTEDLSQWLPCHSYCQMNGAAAAVLSFSDTRVVLNGPSWCSLVAERELMAYHRSLQYRLYSSHAEQPDLLFGTGEKIRELVDELQEKYPETSLLAVLTSCSIGLIGDDVHGIVGNMDQGFPVIALDAGGLTGLFEEGYQAAMVAMLEKTNLKRCDAINPKRVNLLGFCSYYPDSSGDLFELKRLLTAAGFEVGVCPGQHGLKLRELEELPMAALNIVLAPELGLRTACYLKDRTGQEYAVMPVPYGIKQTLKWLEEIGKKLSVAPDLSELKQEAKLMQENISEEVGALKRIVPNLRFREAVLALPHTQDNGLTEALLHGILEVEEILHIRQGSYTGESEEKPKASRFADLTNNGYGPKDAGADCDNSLKHNICESKKQDDAESAVTAMEMGSEKEWLPSDYRLLFGTFADRMRMGDYEHTVYINMFKADGLIRRKYKTFVGIEGWGSLIEEIVEQILTLYYLKEERQKPL